MMIRLPRSSSPPSTDISSATGRRSLSRSRFCGHWVRQNSASLLQTLSSCWSFCISATRFSVAGMWLRAAETCVSLELSICWPCVCCGGPRQGVRHCEVLPRDVRDCEAVPHHPEPETLEPEGELVKAFLRAKQWFVICFNVEVEVVRQAFTCPCKGQSLLFYLGISLFCRGEGPRFIGDWLELSVVLFLQKDCTDSVR